jgi:hypothetical protein
LNTTNVMRVLLPSKPSKIEVSAEYKTTWDESSKTCFLSFENNPDGVKVKLNY